MATQRLKECSDFRWDLVTYVVINGMFWDTAVAFHWGCAARRRVDALAVETEIARLRADR